MDYSLKEQRSDLVQQIVGISLFSFILVSQFFIIPLSESTSDNQSYFNRYYLILSIMLIIDMVSSFIILINSNDYDKHKYLRRNVAVLFGIIGTHLVFIVPYIDDKAFGISNIHWIVSFLALIKIINHVKVFSIFQEAYKSIKPLE